MKARLRNGETLIGTLVTLPAPEIAEIIALAGFDYLWIDTEHALNDFTQAQRMIQAAGGRCPCLIRVPDQGEVWLKRALDTGCDGVVVPQIRSAADARQVVARCLYPPEGQRSVGIARAHGYGMTFQEYVESINRDLVIVLQVEHIEGVRNIASIVQVPGIDAILVGPFDLSGSLNLLGQVAHPRVQETIEQVRRCCQQAEVPVGIFCADVPAAQRAVADGFSLIALGTDAAYLWQSARAALAQVRSVSS